jgi:hypothetical protein
MSFIEDVFKGGNIVTGLAIGIGCLILAPIIVPAVVGIVKPVAKLAIKGGVVLYRKGQGAISETVEAVSDVVAEAKAEVHQGTET